MRPTASSTEPLLEVYVAIGSAQAPVFTRRCKCISDETLRRVRDVFGLACIALSITGAVYTCKEWDTFPSGFGRILIACCDAFIFLFGISIKCILRIGGH